MIFSTISDPLDTIFVCPLIVSMELGCVSRWQRLHWQSCCL